MKCGAIKPVEKDATNSFTGFFWGIFLSSAIWVLIWWVVYG